MGEAFIYRVLDRPIVYRLAQAVFAPGADRHLTRRLADLTRELPTAERIADIGCGPSSLLWRVGVRPIGVDLSFAYSAAFRRAGGAAVTGSAASLPFADGSVGGAWTVGLLHHLPDEVAAQAIREMCRVVHPRGYVVIWDNVLPAPAWRRPAAYAIRRLDRGQFVRSQEHLLSLLPSRPDWRVERFTYSYVGLEMLGMYLVRE